MVWRERGKNQPGWIALKNKIEKMEDALVNLIDKILAPTDKVIDTIQQMPMSVYVEVTVLGLLIITVGTMIFTSGMIQMIYAFLTVLILVLGFATAWNIYSKNEKKFLSAWNIPMTLYWISSLIVMQFDGRATIAIAEAIALSIGSLPVIFVLKRYP
jgi:hypothetical protein